MDKQITTAITYELPIKDLDYVKEFMSNLHETSKELKKSFYWEYYVKHMIELGLKVVFIHLWNTEDTCVDKIHYKEEMVFEAFIGFGTIGSELYSMGEFAMKNVDSLCKRYENNPDFIFTQLDWNAPKDVIIKEFLDELKKSDFIEK